MAFRKVGRMGGYLIRDYAGLDVLAVWQTEVLFRRDITEHGATVPANHRCADTRCDVIIAGRDVRRERSERIEGGLITFLELLFHVDLDQMHGDVPRSFDHDLHIVAPGNPGQLAQRFQLGKLCLIVRVRDRTWPEAVAQTE